MPSASQQQGFDLIEDESRRYLVGNRTASTALLAWFLETVWRMEPEDASNAICDGGGDKGIDALDANEDLMEITAFQAKRRAGSSTTQGDADLRTFVGVAAYFVDEGGIDALLASSPNEELRRLVERLELRQKLAGRKYTVRLVFVTNALLDPAGRDYVTSRTDQDPALEVWDRSRLIGVAERTQSLAVQPLQVHLPLASAVIEEQLDNRTRLAVTLVSAPELVRLPGIDDLSIFELNVRLGLGKTRINKDLAATIIKSIEHPLFPAYHNGLTLLTRKATIKDGEITLNGVSVVNGCQSLLALYNNRTHLTPDLRVLVKVVELGESLDLVDSITYRTNNQNPVNNRDLRSTDPIQRDLQAQVQEHYGNELGYAIRNGETLATPHTLDNATAAQLAMAVYLREPWNAVRKVRLFDEEYHRVFGRNLDGHRLYLLFHLNNEVAAKKSRLRGDLEASFASVRFTVLHLLGLLIGTFPEGAQFLATPQRWFPEKKQEVLAVVGEFVDEVIDSVNFYVESKEEEASDNGTTFDPKVAFKSKSGVQPLERDVLQMSRRTSRRDPSYGFHVAPVR